MTEITGHTSRLGDTGGLGGAGGLMRVITSADGRHIALPGTFNLRDVGGYPTRDGGTVRWRALLRSDALHRVDADGTAALGELNLRTVIDLRTHVEAEISPSALDDLGARTLHISILGGDLHALPAELSETYRHIADECGAAIGAAIQRLCAPGALPALIHCSAGKDRTGIVVALILATVGVPDEVVAADYARLSSRLTARPSGRRPELILDVLARARALAGSVEGYLLRHGLDRDDQQRLRAALVEYPDRTEHDHGDFLP